MQRGWLGFENVGQRLLVQLQRQSRRRARPRAALAGGRRGRPGDAAAHAARRDHRAVRDRLLRVRQHAGRSSPTAICCRSCRYCSCWPRACASRSSGCARRLRPFLAPGLAALVAAALVLPLTDSIAFNQQLSRPDVRMRAKTWVETQHPGGQSASPATRTDRRWCGGSTRPYFRAAGMHPVPYRLLRLKLPVPGQPDGRHSISWLRRHRVRYVIVTSPVYDRILAAADQLSEAGRLLPPAGPCGDPGEGVPAHERRAGAGHQGLSSEACSGSPSGSLTPASRVACRPPAAISSRPRLAPPWPARPVRAPHPRPGSPAASAGRPPVPRPLRS